MQYAHPRSHALFACSLLFLVVALFAGCGGTPQAGSPTAPPYHQAVTTDQNITEIHTGTGVDPNTHEIQGETGTFKAGQTVYLVFVLVYGGYPLTIKLFQGSSLKTQEQLQTRGGDAQPYTTSTVVQDIGEYTWELDYPDLHSQASITFQVL